MFGGNFAPASWLFCNGQLLPISENEALFQLIGTTYGGDGESTFALPNLQSRVPMHMGAGPDGVTYSIAQMGGTESVTLTTQQIPVHTHPQLAVNAAATSQDPSGRMLARPSSTQPGLQFWGSDGSAPMNNSAIQPVGGSQPHENCQPYLCVSFIISLFGIYPSPT
jgi:microcystin-dependent protein